MEEKSTAKRGGRLGDSEFFPPSQHSSSDAWSLWNFIGMFSSIRTSDRELASSLPPVIVDAGDDINNPPDLYGWSVWLWHGETDPGGSIIPISFRQARPIPGFLP